MSIVLVGATSGSVTLQEPAVAGTTVLDLPATSGTILTTTGGVTPGTAGNVLTSNGTTWTSATPAVPTQKVINVQTLTNSTRASISPTTTPTPLVTFTYNKQSASSSLIFIVMIALNGNYSSGCACDLTYGSSSAFGSLAFTYTAQPSPFPMLGQATLTGYTTTGSQTLTVRYYGIGSTAAPSTIVNPNSSDDTRNIQQVSTVTVIEYS